MYVPDPAGRQNLMHESMNECCFTKKAHQKRPEPLGMLLSVRVLNLETDTVASAAASKAMRF